MAQQARDRWGNYLTGILGLPIVLRIAILDQGYISYDTFEYMNDSDVSNLCQTIRKPGGQIPNPAHVDNPEAPVMINDPGTPVGDLFEKRLKQLAYYLKYIRLVQRPFHVTHATVPELQRLWQYKTLMEDRLKEDRPTYSAKYTSSKNAREVLEDMEQWISQSYGHSDIPLSYIIRPDSEIPNAVDDPFPIGSPTYDLELIRRAEHGGEIYNSNNELIWNMVRSVTHGTDAWAFVKSFSRARDGRGAISALKTQFMGTSHVNKLKLDADATLELIYWSGKARNFTWQSFVSRLTSAFADLEEHGAGKTDEEKVRKLIRAIRDPHLAVAKSVVQADPRYNEHYQEAINYIGGQLAQQESNTRVERQISDMHRTTGRGVRATAGRNSGRSHGRFGDGRGRGRGRTGGRFSTSGHLLNNGGYPKDVWKTFTKEEMDFVNDLRKKNPTKHTVSDLHQEHKHEDKKQKTTDNGKTGIGSDMLRPGRGS